MNAIKAAIAGVAAACGLKAKQLWLTNEPLDFLLPTTQSGAVYEAELPGSDVVDALMHPELPKFGEEDERGARCVRKTAYRLDGTAWRIEVVWEHASSA